MKHFSKIESEKRNSFLQRKEPISFIFWLFIGSISILFFTLSILNIYFQITTNHINFKLPAIFWLSTLVMIVSSLCLQKANQVSYRDNFSSYRNFLGATFGLGIAFICLQLIGWQQLIQNKIDLHNTRGALLYTISGLHIIHLLGGLTFLGIELAKSIQHPTYVDSFIYSVNPPNQLRIKLLTYYWHFVDILWLYLFLFFVFFQS